MSSPLDSAFDMKKRRRLAQLKEKAETKKEVAQPQPSFNMGIGDCDLGASPVISKGSVFTKKSKDLM